MAPKGSDEKHSLMVVKFIDYLKKERINRYSVELPVPLNKKGDLGFIDVAVFNMDRMFLFDIKSGDGNFLGDIQKMRKYIFSLDNISRYSWRVISGFLVYNHNSKEKVVRHKNMFRNISVLILNEDDNSICDLDNIELKEIIKLKGKFPKLISILNVFFLRRD